ncbi:MAG: hypothetical protein IAE97_12440 [Chthoniobacterales bacterium]|nr:hypothetical protein [Chthoniobacterales bacterium]
METYSHLRFVALLMGLALLPITGSAATLMRASGKATVIAPKGEQADAASLVNTELPPGTIITTGDDGQVVVELAPGIVITMRSETQVTIEPTKENGATDSLGNPMPELYITLTVGTIVLNTTAEGLGIAYDANGELIGYTKGGNSIAGYSKDSSKSGPRPTGAGLVVRTPRGNISPVLPGEAIITVTGDDPDLATVTVQAEVGSMIATDTEGQQIPVPEGLVVILRPGLIFTPPPGNVPSVNQPSALPTPRPRPVSP